MFRTITDKFPYRPTHKQVRWFESAWVTLAGVAQVLAAMVAFLASCTGPTLDQPSSHVSPVGHVITQPSTCDSLIGFKFTDAADLTNMTSRCTINGKIQPVHFVMDCNNGQKVDAIAAPGEEHHAVYAGTARTWMTVFIGSQWHNYQYVQAVLCTGNNAPAK